MKPFADVAKWSEDWFVQLDPLHKLAVVYIWETCDSAGVFEKPGLTASLLIASTPAAGIDWDKLLDAPPFMKLSNGKYWLPRFFEIQHPKGISVSSNYDAEARRSIRANGLPIQIGKDGKEGSGKDKATLGEGSANHGATLEEPCPKVTDRIGKDRIGKDREGQKGGLGEKPADLPDLFGHQLPVELQTDEFRHAWKEWASYRREFGKPLNKAATGIQLKELSKMGHDDALDAITRAIVSGWSSPYPPDPKGGGDKAAPPDGDPSPNDWLESYGTQPATTATGKGANQ